MKRLLCATLLVVATFTSIAAQNSFIVADKNGNSQLVQSLTFQQQQNGFTWKADDSKTGDIKDLLFIARTNQTLSTGTTTDVTTMLEELSGTDQADAEAVVAALKSNPQVIEASSGDGNNVAVKLNASEGYIYYPMYDMQTIFKEEDIPEEVKMAMSVPMQARRASSDGTIGKVAIFNYFRGSDNYRVQNRIMESLIEWFKQCGYDVNEYGDGAVYYSDFGYKEMPFTLANVQSVLNRGNGTTYKAVIFMTHGVVPAGRTPLIATRDIYTEQHQANKEEGYFDPTDNQKYLLTSVEHLLENVSSPIVYLGACDGVNQGGFLKKDDRFPVKNNTCVVGWAGKTRIAQAHAAMMFYYMLYGGYTMPRALDGLPDKDPNYSDSQMYKWNVSDLQSLSGDTFGYNEYFTANIAKGRQSQGPRGGVLQPFEVELSEVPFKCWLQTQLRNPITGKIYQARTVIVEKGKSLKYRPTFEIFEDGIYSLEVFPYNKEETDFGSKRIKFYHPVCVIKSENFKDLSATLDFSDEDLYAPQILGSDDQPVTEISLPAGSSKTFQVDAYSGHTLSTPCLDTDVCKVSLSGSTLTVTGVSEGSTYFGVYDKDNKQIAVAEVTVTAGGGDIPSYTSCPDDHHPHLIDLGLPSGTKWACCNVGASKPEDYGGYYAWGETEEKSIYDPRTYTHSSYNIFHFTPIFHDIGTDIAGTQYDAATANWGSPWVMPSQDQMKELKDNSTSEWTTENGVNGRRFTASNGASIFLPAAGCHLESEEYNAGFWGYYWSSSLSDESSMYEAWSLFFGGGNVSMSPSSFRSDGQSVRPVCKN